MLDTLYGKTFIILGTQLGVTWISTIVLLTIFRNLYRAKVTWISGDTDQSGNLDLSLDWNFIKPYFWILFAVNIAVFLTLLFYGRTNLFLGIPLFTFWSILTGLELALCLVSVNENLGGTVLALTAIITFAAGAIGTWSGIDFSFLRAGLFGSLLLLLGYGFIRLFFSIPRWVQRLWAFFGVVVFTGYLLYDFNRLSKLSEHAGTNNWTTAMEISISIYLDVINLFLYLLDLIS